MPTAYTQSAAARRFFRYRVGNSGLIRWETVFDADRQVTRGPVETEM
jgi:hypothetical protein